MPCYRILGMIQVFLVSRGCKGSWWEIFESCSQRGRRDCQIPPSSLSELKTGMSLWSDTWRGRDGWLLPGFCCVCLSEHCPQKDPDGLLHLTCMLGVAEGCADFGAEWANCFGALLSWLTNAKVFSDWADRDSYCLLEQSRHLEMQLLFPSVRFCTKAVAVKGQGMEISCF